MGTRFAITCYHGDSNEAKVAADAAFDQAERINQVASDYIADSELLGLSKHPDGAPVAVSPLLFQLILEASNLAEKTGGLFDPTLGPLTRLWRESRRRKALPAPGNPCRRPSGHRLAESLPRPAEPNHHSHKARHAPRPGRDSQRPSRRCHANGDEGRWYSPQLHHCWR